MAEKPFEIFRVNSLPATGVNGDWYILKKGTDRHEIYIVQPNGTLTFVKGITDDENNRLNQLTQPQITKLIGLKNQTEITNDINTAVNQANGAPIAVTGTVLPQGTNVPAVITISGQADLYGGTGGTTYTQTGGASITVTQGKFRKGYYTRSTDLWTASTQEYDLPVDPNSVKKSELIGESSNNIYNYNDDVVNFIITNLGVKSFTSNARMGQITLSPSSTHITFKLSKDPAQAVNKYYSFYDSSDVQIPNAFGIANSNANPSTSVTVSIPSGASKVYFTSKNSTEVDTIRETHMVNYGQTSLPFIKYNGTLKEVAGLSLIEYAKRSEIATPALVDQKISELVIPVVETESLPNYNILKAVNRHINWFISTTPNAGISFGTNWAIWFFPVNEISPMTVSGWLSTRAELAFFNGAMPTTPSTGVNSQVIRSGTLGQLGIPAKVGGQTTFTPPTGTTWGCITIKGTTETDDVFSSLQINYGTEALPYMNGDVYTEIATKIDDNDMVAKYLENDLGVPLTYSELKESITPISKGRITIKGDDQYINVSYPHEEGTLLHKVWSFKPLAADYPNVIDFNDVFFNDVLLHDQADVVAPYRVEGTTIGANHGYYKTRVTATAHGKTNVDVGSIWTDGSDQWIIVNIYDTNNFDISARLSNISLWSGTTLTHVSGATNTNTVNATAKVSWQMYPCFKDRVIKYYIDNQEVSLNNLSNLTANESFVINESYSILRKTSIMEWFIANVGNPSKVIQVDGLPIIRASNSYTFKGDGNVITNVSFLALEDIAQFQDIMFIMNNEFVPQTNIKFYVPGTLPFTQSSVNYNFTNLTELPNDLPTRLNFTPARIDNTVKYPSRILQYGTDWGFAMGYLPVYDTSDSVRPNNASRKALQISEIRKTYMSAIDSTGIISLNKGQYYSTTGYKSYFKSDSNNSNYIVEDNNFFLWYLDFHTFGTKIINVPSKLIGLDFEIYDKTGNVVLYSKQLTSEIQLEVSNSSNYGYIIIKVNK